MKKNDTLPGTIEKSLTDLLNDKDTDSDTKRKNLLLAIKWQAVKAKMDDGDWGAGFGKKGEGDEEGEPDDE